MHHNLSLLSKQRWFIGELMVDISMQSHNSADKNDQSPLPTTASLRETAKHKSKALDHSTAAQKSITGLAAEASCSVAAAGVASAESHPQSKESPVPLDLRRTKTAGEALLRPSATDGLIARASKRWAPHRAGCVIITAFL